MRALTLVHRWLGVAFCLFFAMWFASGIVMHFVPFPSLTEPERLAGASRWRANASHASVDSAVRASGLRHAERVRFFARADGMVYVVQEGARMVALHADSLAPASVRSEALALAIATAHAGGRGLDALRARVVELAEHDQWTVPNNLDAHRPLYRVALDDRSGTELYVSSVTGEVVRDTTRLERAANYLGSVVHWIYPTVLRRNWAAWDATVWWFSLVASIAAAAGLVLGVLRLRVESGRVTSPYRGWHAWHHWLGLACSLFVLTWIVSGWLSMDHGRLFSTGKLDAREARVLAPEPVGTRLAAANASRSAGDKLVEVEWFRFAGRNYRRERTADRQVLVADSRGTLVQIPAEEMSAWMRRLSPDCSDAAPVAADDAYPIASPVAGEPVFRVVCGDTWYHLDAATGAVLEKLDPSRRAYRWFYSALHTLDFPALARKPVLRTLLVVVLCAAGLAFSVTAVVIGWRRLTS
jgi:hypothetical protein